MDRFTEGEKRCGCYDVLLHGTYFCDLIFTGLPEMPSLGKEIYSTGFEIVPGGTFSAAQALTRLGLRTGWPCDFGSDFFSQYVLAEAQRSGLDTSLFRIHDGPVRRVTVSLSFPHDRSFVTYIDRREPPSLLPYIEQHEIRCLYLMGLECGPEFQAAAAAARASGAVILMDCQSTSLTLDHPAVAAALQSVDIFAPNESEALQLTGADSLEQALDILAGYTPLVVIKSGSRGAFARRGEETLYVPGLSGLNVVDTTGAGDCFNAGFLYSYLQGHSLRCCLESGNISGGLSTTAPGGRAAPTAAQLEEWRQKIYR
ncbi:MAG: carbohydrate kinase family protein [Chloroflexi bacterium]|nr:carbohydrate kinase family protein [Chloroflexota bacterium]